MNGSSPGTHINAIGADAAGKQELESTLLKRAKIVVDDIAQAVHSGEVNVHPYLGNYSREGYLCSNRRDPDWQKIREEQQ